MSSGYSLGTTCFAPMPTLTEPLRARCWPPVVVDGAVTQEFESFCARDRTVSVGRSSCSGFPCCHESSGVVLSGAHEGHCALASAAGEAGQDDPGGHHASGDGGRLGERGGRLGVALLGALPGLLGLLGQPAGLLAQSAGAGRGLLT